MSFEGGKTSFSTDLNHGSSCEKTGKKSTWELDLKKKNTDFVIVKNDLIETNHAAHYSRQSAIWSNNNQSFKVTWVSFTKFFI